MQKTNSLKRQCPRVRVGAGAGTFITKLEKKTFFTISITRWNRYWLYYCAKKSLILHLLSIATHRRHSFLAPSTDGFPNAASAKAIKWSAGVKWHYCSHSATLGSAVPACVCLRPLWKLISFKTIKLFSLTHTINKQQQHKATNQKRRRIIRMVLFSFRTCKTLLKCVNFTKAECMTCCFHAPARK